MWSNLTLMLWHFLFHGCHVEYVFKTRKVKSDLKSLDFQSSRNKTKFFIMMKVSCHANEQQINHKIIHTRFVLPSTSLSIRTFWNHNNLCKIIVNVNSIQSLYHNWCKNSISWFMVSITNFRYCTGFSQNFFLVYLFLSLLILW